MDYQIYREKREDWKPAIEVYADWKAQEARRAKLTFEELLGDLTKGAVSITIALVRLGISNDPKDAELWVTSPSCNTTVKLPFYVALRTVRNRGWWVTDTEPIKALEVEEVKC